MNKQVRGNRFFILLLLVLLVSLYFSRILSNQTSYEYNTYTLIKDIEKGTVSEILLNQNKETPSGEVDVTFNNGASKSFYVTNLQEIEDKLYEMSQSEEYKDSFAYTVGPMEKTSILVMILPYLFGLVLFFMLFSMMNGAQGGGGNSKLSNFGKSRARMTGAGDVDKTFADVAGLTEEKEQLEEIVDFLKAPKKYTELGARIPKGVLMVGPQEQVRLFLQRQLPVRQEFHFSVYQVLILLRCLLVLVRHEYVIFSRKLSAMHHVLYLLTRLTLLQEDVEAVLEADMMKENRLLTRC